MDQQPETMQLYQQLFQQTMSSQESPTFAHHSAPLDTPQTLENQANYEIEPTIQTLFQNELQN